MSKTIIANCPKCGAPIYTESAWWGITPPPNEYSCNCVPHPNTTISTNTTGKE